jgi:hypothetical protein
MARFISVHPLTLTEPAARFTPLAGDPALFEVVSDDPAVVLSLRGLGARFGIVEDPEPQDLKGAALDDALEAAGLSKSGTVKEKRARLAEHHAQLQAEAQAQPVPTPAELESQPVPAVDDSHEPQD